MSKQNRRAYRVVLVALLCALVAPGSWGQDEGPTLDLRWQPGPTTGRLAGLAVVDVPEGYVFLNRPDTIALLEALENPTSGDELGTLAAQDDSDWLLSFSFDEIGFVEDDEQDALDADELLESFRVGTEQANEERRARGWTPISIDGWSQEPAYNPSTNNLEWALRGISAGEVVLNHDIRLLGRSGVMKAKLLVSPEEYDGAIAEVRTLLGGFRFTDGNAYGDYRAGDRVAEYGLAALITGGGAAVALKTGLFKKFWKLIVVAALAIAGVFKKLLGGGRRAAPARASRASRASRAAPAPEDE